MKSKRKTWLWIGINICRFLLAVTFLFSGIVKLIDPRGTQYKISDYAVLFHLNDYLPQNVALAMSVALAVLEAYLGFNLFFGIRRRTTSRIILAFMMVMTPLTLMLALRGDNIDCGCFGEAVHLSAWQTFAKNLVLLPASILIVCFYRKMTRFITERNQWMLSLYALLFFFCLAIYCIRYLPIIDFRPYQIGVDLPKEIEAEWEGKSEEMKYIDLMMQTPEGEDITMPWLTQKGYKFLLISPYLDLADDSSIDAINQIYDYSQQQGYPFLCLTSSDEEIINRWKDQTGAEYPFAQTDGVLLKTVIRSNPGIILLHDGVIYGKWSTNDLPNVEQLTTPLEGTEYGLKLNKSRMGVIYKMLLWFLTPLFIWTMIDRIWVGRKFYRRYKMKKEREV